MEKEFTLRIEAEMALLCDMLRICPKAVLQLYIEHVDLDRMEEEPPNFAIMIATVLFFRDDIDKYKTQNGLL
ncbi:hypothetical protein SAMN05421788_113124 [Filimonas lacunae]|uniref:Uncharacterized protein n=1 Tax=Filimonas lacunae TaxID=477680 RepID=A0A173MBM2_9BACT|nr:hypothetical protein [Filimonas lacunae]BAV04922.1 hypothetical protein FLA_0922 [Filimonas lacunae]SIT33790.1 hypothetical protein SAMN05421788_113124 [Filimonas lacunae]